MPIKINNKFSAILFSNKKFQWHRLNGPAYIDYYDREEYWIEHELYSVSEYHNKIKEMEL